MSRAPSAPARTWHGSPSTPTVLRWFVPDCSRQPHWRRQAIPFLPSKRWLLAAGAARQSEAYEEATRRLDAAEKLARACEVTALLGEIAFERGNLLANSGDLKGALSEFEVALREACGRGDPVLEAMALNNLAFHALLAGDLPRADRDIKLALEVTERFALNFLVQYVQSTSGEIALAQGRLDAAGAAFALAEQAARTWNNSIHVANVRVRIRPCWLKPEAIFPALENCLRRQALCLPAPPIRSSETRSRTPSPGRTPMRP